MNSEQTITPVAWGIFGFFPDSGGWCLQAGKVYTSQAAAIDAYLGEYENSSRFMVMPLFASPVTDGGGKIQDDKK